jgi:YVTN family beta-propeller protein
MYVADKGTGTISVINTTSNAVIATVGVNPSAPLPNSSALPIALAETPNGGKVYSVNQGDSSVTSINTVDDSVATRITGFPAPPNWAVASADSAYIYVLDQSGTISVIDTLSDSIVSSSAAAGAGANYIFYDKLSNRLYVPNPATATVTVLDVSGNTLVAHTAITIAAAGTTGCTAAVHPTSITVLGDESRAYVASYTDASANNIVCAQVDVIDNGTLQLAKAPIALPQAAGQGACASTPFRVFVASTAGGTNSPFKVFVSQCDAGLISDIYTFAASTGPDPHPADVFMSALPAPVSSANSAQLNISATAQSGNLTTYTYSTIAGPALQVGSTVVITGMTDTPNHNNNGVFVVSAIPGAGTFSVSNPAGEASTGQNGNGTALAVGNPLFLVPGP